VVSCNEQLGGIEWVGEVLFQRDHILIIRNRRGDGQELTDGNAQAGGHQFQRLERGPRFPAFDGADIIFGEFGLGQSLLAQAARAPRRAEARTWRRQWIMALIRGIPYQI
jgi:hypothetical protein